MRFFLFTVLLFWGLVSYSQTQIEETDYHKWNNTVIQFWDNPALTGQSKAHNIFFNYRQNWKNEEAKFDEMQGAYDFLISPFKKPKYSIGIGIYYDGNFNKVIRSHSIVLSSSFKIMLGDRHQMSIGLNLAGYTNKKLNIESIGFFPNQFIGYDFSTELAYGELVEDDKLTSYGPLNMGLWFQGERYFAGLSLNNITRPNESFSGLSTIKSPINFNAGGGYHFSAASIMTISPSLLYRTIAFNTHTVDVRLLFGFFKDQLSFGSLYQNKRIYFTLGGDVFKHLQLNFDFSPIRVGGEVNDTVNLYMQAYIKVYFGQGNKTKKKTKQTDDAS